MTCAMSITIELTCEGILGFCWVTPKEVWSHTRSQLRDSTTATCRNDHGLLQSPKGTAALSGNG